MFGPYSLIVILFGFASLALTIWSWRKISRAKAQLTWPSTTAEVILSELDSNRLPTVKFRYGVDSASFERSLQFSDEILSAPDGAKRCVEKYPLASQFRLHYQPDDVENFTLAPGPARDEKLIFIIGICSFLFALALILFII